MRKAFLLLVLIASLNSFAQELPTDSIILRKIFGKTDRRGQSYSRPFDEEKGEGMYTYGDSIVWKIVYKARINLQNKNLIFSIVEAEGNNQMGHQFGYRNMYFFKQKHNRIQLVDSIVSDEERPLGDDRTYKIADIGKNNKALIIQFSSTGNHHFESSETISLLEVGKVTHLLSTNNYSNAAWKMPESENDDCDAETYHESYEIIRNETCEWYDVKVHRIDYRFTKGCKDSYEDSITDKVYVYEDGK